jgi:ATP-binding cassette, subfamily B, bacterial
LSTLESEETENMSKDAFNGQSKRAEWLWLWTEVKPHLRLILSMLFFISLFSASSVVLPWSVGKITTALNKNNMRLIYEGAFIVLLFFVAQGVLNFFQNLLAAKLNLRILKQLRDRSFSRVLKLDFSFFSGTRVGDFIYRITANVDGVGSMVDLFLQQAVPAFLTIAVLMGYLFYLNALLTILILVLAPILALAVFVLGKVILRTSQQAQEAVSRMSSYLSEFITGIGVIKNFAKEEFEERRFFEITEKYRGSRYKVEKAQALQFPLMGLVNGVCVMALICLSGFLVYRGKLTASQILPYITAVAMVINPVLKIGQVYTQIKNYQVSLQRVIEFFETTSNLNHKKRALKSIPAACDIRFDAVTFGYNPKQVVLHQLDLTVGEKEVVGIVGLSGAGKSTLLNLMMRFYDPVDGRVLIGGVDLRDLKETDLRRQFGVVMQETFLFSGSIASNIAYGEKQFDREQMERAAKLAHAHEFIEKLPSGYNTAINERGLNLSGGQKQRLSIARALYHNPKILIMDEATSNIDAKSESMIQKSIELLRKNMTIIIVAHRFATIRNADRIVVLDRGRIIEQGSHEQLMQSDEGQYQRLYSTQMFVEQS